MTVSYQESALEEKTKQMEEMERQNTDLKDKVSFPYFQADVLMHSCTIPITFMDMNLLNGTCNCET